MNSEIKASATDRDETGALHRALEQSHEVRDKVEACADELAAKNEAIKQQISQGDTTLPADSSLREGEAVEAKVQECADDLHEVTLTLAKGVEDLRKVERALAGSQAALERTESSLADAQDLERQSSQRALHDAATGLPNRSLFDDRLAQALSVAERHERTLAVMFLDLDRFKQINDQHGHAVGDFVLKEVASRLQQRARDEDTVCRTGGDEFLYLLIDPHGPTNVERIAQDILANIARPMVFQGLTLIVKPSIGIATYPDAGVTAADLVAHADAAMYAAKRSAAGFALWGSTPSGD